MPVLPYCVLLEDSARAIPDTGVLGSGIHRLAEGALLVLYAQLSRSELSQKTFQPAALEFHKVVHAVFNHAAVVPFRFPTWLTLPELGKHLQEASQRYTDFLRAHASQVQMEVRLTVASRTWPGVASSGTAHLQARAAEWRQLQDTAKAFKDLLSPEVIEWRERDTRQGLRLCALVERANIAAFRERLRKHEGKVAMLGSGPWPATEFLSGERSEHEGHEGET